MKKQTWISILTVLGAYAIILAATCFMWLGAECVIEKFANLGTVDIFFAAYFAWGITRGIAGVGKKIQENSHGNTDIQV